MTEDAQALLQVGLEAAKAKNYDEAIRLLSQANSLSPNNPRVLTPLGFAYYRNGDNIQAQQYLEQSLALDSNQPKVHQIINQIRTENPFSTPILSPAKSTAYPPPTAEKRKSRAKKTRSHFSPKAWISDHLGKKRQPKQYRLVPIRLRTLLLTIPFLTFICAGMSCGLYWVRIEVSTRVKELTELSALTESLVGHLRSQHARSMLTPQFKQIYDTYLAKRPTLSNLPPQDISKLRTFDPGKSLPDELCNGIVLLSKSHYLLFLQPYFMRGVFKGVRLFSILSFILGWLAVCVIRASIPRRRFLVLGIVISLISINWWFALHQAELVTRRVQEVSDKVLQGQTIGEFKKDIRDYLALK